MPVIVSVILSTGTFDIRFMCMFLYVFEINRGKIHFRSQILELLSIDKYWNICGILLKNVIFSLCSLDVLVLSSSSQ